MLPHLWDKGQKFLNNILLREELREVFEEDQRRWERVSFLIPWGHKKNHIEFTREPLSWRWVCAFNYAVKANDHMLAYASPSPVRARKEQDSCTEGCFTTAVPGARNGERQPTWFWRRVPAISPEKGNTFGLLLNLSRESVSTSGHMWIRISCQFFRT